MTKLEDIHSLCKCGVFVSINEHRDYYESVKEHLTGDEVSELAPDVLAEMVKRDIVIACQFYPDTPISSYIVYHYDLDACLTAALEILSTIRPPLPNG